MSSFRPRMGASSPQNPWQSAATAGMPRSNGTSLARPLPRHFKINFKWVGIVLLSMVVSNLVSHLVFNPQVMASKAPAEGPVAAEPGETLYLLEKAGLFVPDTRAFETKEWLMAVMYSESKFDATVQNFKGSGATGLIQFMPAAASDLGVSLSRLRRMDPIQQMDYVFGYLQMVRERYGEFNSLTDLYLAVLYPKAMGQDFCYILYAHPTRAFKQNAGLDENGDRYVSVSDIDRRMKRLYPTAYMTEKG
jgi:hypothetical protein